jgi:hypothetical protein
MPCSPDNARAAKSRVTADNRHGTDCPVATPKLLSDNDIATSPAKPVIYMSNNIPTPVSMSINK